MTEQPTVEDDGFLCGCGGILKQSHVDDVGTVWFKCSTCGRTEPLAEIERNRLQSLREIQEHEKELTKPLTVDDLIEILGSTVKHDNENKAITFLSMLLTYTEDDQINLGFLAESSTGKSYIPLELSWYFPKEDVIKTGYCSPTAFFHDWGTLLPDPSDKRDVEDKDKRKITHIDLHQKILIFLDQPHDQLLQRLRSLLSHDEKQIIVKITDKREKSGLRTKNIIIEGYPTVEFCTARYTMQDQEKTRLLLLSPEIDQEKLRETIALRIDKEGDREAFYKRMMEDPQRRLLANRVWSIRQEHIAYVKIPEDLRNQIYQHFLDGHKFLIPRHQRDITRLLAIIKGHALLNYTHRERIENSIVVNLEDVEVGFRLYSTVSEANELGLSPELFNVYQKLKPRIENFENGITRKDFQKLYYQELHKVIGQDSANNILKIWASVGLITEQPDPNDRRVLRYMYPDMGTFPSKTDNAQTSILSKDELLSPSIPSKNDTIKKEGTHVKTHIVSEGTHVENKIDLRNDDKLEVALGHKPKPVKETIEEAARRQDLIQCQECKAKGKQLFFAADADLAAHMKAYHEGEGRI